MNLRAIPPSGRSDTPPLLEAFAALTQERALLLSGLFLLLVGGVYFGAARVGLALTFSTKEVSAIWPPTGIALAALMALGYRVWPAIFAGAFLANGMSHESLPMALSIASGNTATALLGAYLLRRLGFNGALESSRDVVGLIGVAMGSTLVSATCGTTTLALESIVPWSDYSSVWWAWWTSNSLGILILTPVLLTWINRPRIDLSRARLVELAGYLGAAALIGVVVFVLPSGSSPLFYPRAYVSFPLVAWGGLRFGARETALAVAIIAALAVWGGVHGHGPFGHGLLGTRLILLDTFVATVGCTALLIAAVTAERRGAREAARESESLLQEIINHTPAVIYVKDLQGRYLMVNRRYEELWNRPDATVLGRSDYDVFPPQEAERFRAMDQRVVAAGRALTEEEVAARKDGPHTYVSVKFPLRSDVGETYAVVGISTDITELHHAQARLREAYEALEERVRERTAELAAAVEELGHRNQEKETLLREIHHRVKNNLQVVCSLLNLQADGHEPHLVAFAQECKARVRSMALVHEHLYQAKNLQSVPLSLYVRGLVEEVLRSQPVAGRIGCTIDVQEITLPIDQAIPCGLIVNELVTNALKHAFPGARSGHIAVSISETAGNVVLTVRDDGIGTGELVELSRSPGFGLSLVAMLADQLHASVDMAGNRGTHVNLRFSRREGVTLR